MHIAIARMHMQRNEDATAQYLLVDRGTFFQNQLERGAVENLAQ